MLTLHHTFQNYHRANHPVQKSNLIMPESLIELYANNEGKLPLLMPLNIPTFYGPYGKPTISTRGQQSKKTRKRKNNKNTRKSSKKRKKY